MSQSPDPSAGFQPDADVLEKLSGSRSRTRTWLVLGAIGFLVVAGGVGMCVRGASGASKWETGTVDRGDLVLGVTAVGVLEPTETASVGSDQNGNVSKVLVSENDSVLEDQILAELDPASLDLLVRQCEARITQAEATVSQASVTEREARKEAERSARMLEQGAAAPIEVDTARLNADKAVAALAMARAQLKDARLGLDLARHNRSEATIRSPLAGTVLTRSVEPGQTVVSALQAATLFEIAADLTEMHLPVEVDEAEVSRVLPGQTATFTVPAWVGRSFDATVEKVHLAPKKGVQVVSYVAELRVNNDDLVLRPGMTATARIVTESLDGVLRVPSEALRFEPETPEGPAGPHIWLVKEGALEALSISVLGTDGSLTAIQAEGLAEGTEVALKANGPRKATAPGKKSSK